MHLSNRQKAIIALIAASTIWGAASPLMKLALQEIPIFSLGFIRFFTAALILYPFVRKKLHLDLKDIPLIIICSILGITIHMAFYLWGLTLTYATSAGIITIIGPLFSLILGYYVLKEKLAKNLLLGAFLGVAGILVIIGKDITGNTFHLSPLGDLLLIIATFLFVCYQLMSKELFQKYDALTITFYTLLIGGIGFFPASVSEFIRFPNWYLHLSIPTIIALTYGIFLASLGAYCLWQWGLSRIDVSKADFFFYLDPVSGTLLAVVLLSEKINLAFILGSVLILSGLFLAEKKPLYHHKSIILLLLKPFSQFAKYFRTVERLKKTEKVPISLE